MKGNLKRRILAGIWVAFVVLVGSSTTAMLAIRDLRPSVDWVTHTRIVDRQLLAVLASTIDVESGARGFALTGLEAFLEPYDAGKRRLPAQLAVLRALVRDSAQQQRLPRLDSLVARRLSLAEDRVRRRRAVGPRAMRDSTAWVASKSAQDSIRTAIALMAAEQAKLLRARERRSESTSRRALGFILVGGLASLATTAGLGLLIRGGFRALREERDLLVDSQRIAQVGSWLSDVTSPAHWSDETYRIYGVTRESFTPTVESFLGLLHPEDLPAMRRWFAALLAGDAPGALEYRTVLPDGSVRLLSARGELLSAASGGRKRVAGTVQDVTARRAAERALREGEALLRSVTEGTPDAVYVKDRQGRYLLVNSAAARMTGIPPAEILGRDDSALFPLDEARAVMEGDRQVIEAGEPRTYEESVTLHGVRQTFLSVKGPVRDSLGQVIGLFGIARDITERKLAEEVLRQEEQKFSDAFHSSPAALSITRIADGMLLDVNESFLRTFGFRRDEVIGRRSTELGILTPDQRAKLIQRQLAVGGLTNEELSAVNRSGATVHLLFSSRPIAVNGEACHLTTLIDISDRKAAEQRLAASNARLQTLSGRLLEIQEAERRSVARELHDELGQSLSAIKINLQTLQRFPAPAATQLAECAAMVDRALQNTRSLSLTLRPPLLDDLGLLPALRWLADQVGQRAGLRVVVESDSPLERLATPIETACFRIAQEALNNAVRHAHARQAVIFIVHTTDRLEVTVRDDGMGFDEPAARQRARGGASMGLMSMEERATLAGGGVQWLTAPGKGTEVRFWVPILSSHAGETA